jgi:PHD/YefM family antitoxin component YafN of YafNO toxin-antitoxin module
MPNTLDISEARKKFNTLDAELEKTPVIIITRHNKDTFAVVNIEYLEAIVDTMDILGDPEAMQMLQESVRAIEDGHLIDQEDVEEEFG